MLVVHGQPTDFLPSGQDYFLIYSRIVISVDYLKYRNLSTGPDGADWICALTNDLGCLAQGVGTHMPDGNNTIFFIPKYATPKHKHIT